MQVFCERNRKIATHEEIKIKKNLNKLQKTPIHKDSKGTRVRSTHMAICTRTPPALNLISSQNNTFKPSKQSHRHK